MNTGNRAVAASSASESTTWMRSRLALYIDRPTTCAAGVAVRVTVPKAPTTKTRTVRSN